MFSSYNNGDLKKAANCIVNRKHVAILIFGIALGSSFSYIFVVTRPIDYYTNPQFVLDDLHHGKNLSDAAEPLLEVGNHSHQGEVHDLENSTVANQLFNEVKVLCWIMTNPSNHKTKAKHVLKTWGSRCNKLLFMSSSTDDEIEAIALPVGEGRDNLWGKTKEAFKYIYANHLNEYDWFLKADDDTYVIVENLRFMLYPYAADMPVYFGCKFKAIVHQGYMSGGAGYVLSREAVRRFVEEAIPNKDKCRQDNNGPEDAEIGQCLENVHVDAVDSRDSFGKGRFYPFVPEQHMIADHNSFPDWYWQYQYYKSDEGLGSCSDNAISFHYMTPNQMYVLDYLIYHLQSHGNVRNSQPLPNKFKKYVSSSAEPTNINQLP